MRSTKLLALLLGMVSLPGVAQAPVVPDGRQFQVNTYTFMVQN